MKDWLLRLERRRGLHGIFGPLNHRRKAEAKLPEYRNNSGVRDHQPINPKVSNVTVHDGTDEWKQWTIAIRDEGKDTGAEDYV